MSIVFISFAARSATTLSNTAPVRGCVSYTGPVLR